MKRYPLKCAAALETADLSARAAEFLRAGGLTDAQIAAVKTAIQK